MVFPPFRPLVDPPSPSGPTGERGIIGTFFTAAAVLSTATTREPEVKEGRGGRGENQYSVDAAGGGTYPLTLTFLPRKKAQENDNYQAECRREKGVCMPMFDGAVVEMQWILTLRRSTANPLLGATLNYLDEEAGKRPYLKTFTHTLHLSEAIFFRIIYEEIRSGEGHRHSLNRF